MIRSLFVTLLVEGFVVAAYALPRKTPIGVLLRASFIVNVFTQPVLWIVLHIFFRHYQAALLITETLIWLVEGLLMHRLSCKWVTQTQSIILSFCMNLSSFGIGWLMPI